MPRVKRYFHVSHGFNRDPEVRELRRQFGDWMGYVWLELCAMGDLNDGVVKGEVGQIASSLAYISMRDRPSLAEKTIVSAMDFMEKRGWIRVETESKPERNWSETETKPTGNPLETEAKPKRNPLESQCVLIVNLLKYRGFWNRIVVPPQSQSQSNSHSSIPRVSDEGPWPSVKLLLETYHTLCPKSPKVLTVSPRRRKKAKQYLGQFSDLEFWEETFRNVNRSNFLMGLAPCPDRTKPFQADFDWLLSRGKDGTENAVKVRDGKYTDIKTQEERAEERRLRFGAKT